MSVITLYTFPGLSDSIHVGSPGLLRPDRKGLGAWQEEEDVYLMSITVAAWVGFKGHGDVKMAAVITQWQRRGHGCQ